MNSNLKLLAVLTSLFLFSLPVFISGVGSSNEDAATQAITEAEESVTSAYEAVLEAEQARANVSELLDLLDAAGKHLAEAHMLYRLGDFAGAVDSADLSSEIGEEVKNSAEDLKIKAYESWIGSLWVRIIGSIAGVIAVVFGTFMAWRVFKGRYLKQVQR